MANIPQYGTRKVTPSGRVGGAAIPFSVADTGQGLEAQALGAIGKGIGDVADVMQEIQERDDKAVDISQASTDSKSIDNISKEFASWKQANPDPMQYDQESITKFWDDYEGATKDLSGYRTPEAKAKAEAYWSANREEFIATQTIKATDARGKLSIENSKASYLAKAARGEGGELERGLTEDAYLNYYGNKEQVSGLMSSLDIKAEEMRVENLVKQGDFESATELTAKTSAFSGDPEKRTSMMNYIKAEEKRRSDGLESQRLKRDEEITSNWLPLMVDGQLDASEQRNAYLTPDARKSWDTIYSKWRDEKSPPTKSKGSGYITARDSVVGFAAGKKSEYQASIDLMNERYVKRSITQEQFSYLAGKIQNPYPNDVAQDVQTVMDESDDDSGLWWRHAKWDDKARMESTINIMKKVDASLKGGKNPDLKTIRGFTAEEGAKTPPKPETERILLMDKSGKKTFWLNNPDQLNDALEQGYKVVK